jgi:hypothetical protein
MDEYDFLFEEALDNKGFTQSQLPDPIKADLRKLKALCHKLADLPEDDKALQESLNSEIDVLDEEISSKINELTNEPPAPNPAPNPAPEPAPAPEEKQDNTLATVGIIGGLGLLIWAGMKFFGGKK